MCACFRQGNKKNTYNLFFKKLLSSAVVAVTRKSSTAYTVKYDTEIMMTILTLICCCFCNCCSRQATVCRDLMSLTGTELSVNSAFSRSSSQHILLCIAIQQQQQTLVHQHAQSDANQKSYISLNKCLQCFDAVGWAAGRASSL